MIKVEFGDNVSVDLKENFEDSHFLSDEYDSAIMGVDPTSGSVIYHYYHLINLKIEMAEKDGFADQFESWDDLYDHFDNEVTREFQSFKNWMKDDQISPTLFMEL